MEQVEEAKPDKGTRRVTDRALPEKRMTERLR